MMNQIFYTKKCSSTNDEIIHYLPNLKKIEDEWITLYTFDQINGRGQYGNIWRIAPNENLAFSMAFHQRKILISDNLLNFHTANILRDFIAKKTETEVKVKWPNDIILQNKKISGMLIERKRVNGEIFIIIGIGINILQESFKNFPKAGSIFTQTNQRFDLNKWALEMNAYFMERLFNPPLSEQILDIYNQNLFRKDIISVFEINKMRQNGIIRNADENGFLWVDLEKDRLKKFYHKEIELLY